MKMETKSAFNKELEVKPHYPAAMVASLESQHYQLGNIAWANDPGLVYMVVQESQRIPTRDSTIASDVFRLDRKLKNANF